MFCRNCGAALIDQARFCNQCGETVPAPASSGLCLTCGSALNEGSLTCSSCGAGHQHCTQCGRLVSKSALGCPGCGFLLRLSAGYELIPGEFEHASMQPMNQALRRSLILNRMAEAISQKVGKPWYESCFNSVQATEKQYARIYELAMIAAQRIGFPRVPAVYIEADRGYQSNTYGTERDAFVNIGTFLPKLLNDRELLFILGHELGHLKGRHALWMTVSMFLVGQARGNLMSEGILSFISNPLKIIESGVESVITNWMRVADLTADRAALLVSGDIALARRTLFLLYFRSRRELDEVDVDEWTRQQESQASTMTKVSQIMTSSTPYLGLRLRALEEFHASPRYAELRNKVESGSNLDLSGLFDDKGNLKKPAGTGGRGKGSLGPPKPGQAGSPGIGKAITGRCPHCQAVVRLPLKGLRNQGLETITCPQCRKTFPLDISRILAGRPKGAPPPSAKPAGRKIKVAEGACPKCGARFALPLDPLPEKPVIDHRCQSCRAMFRVNLDPLRR